MMLPKLLSHRNPDSDAIGLVYSARKKSGHDLNLKLNPVPDTDMKLITDAKEEIEVITIRIRDSNRQWIMQGSLSIQHYVSHKLQGLRKFRYEVSLL